MIVFGNRVLCLVVLFLLQSACWMGMVQGEPLVSVGIRDHRVYKGSSITSGSVTYSSSKSHCEAKGGYLASAYTKALRTAIMQGFTTTAFGSDIRFFIGADMEYSVHSEPDPSKRCSYSVPSLKCIYKWNQGVWANALGNGMGVGFYKGSDPTVKGASLINGYDVTVYSVDNRYNRPYILRALYAGDNFAFMIDRFAGGDSRISIGRCVELCEVQDGRIIRVEATTTTIEAPTTTNTNTTKARTTTNKSQSAGSGVSGTSEKSDDNSGWWKRWAVVVVILPILLLILAILLCLYCCGCICRRKADGRRVTEDSIATIHTDREGIVLQENTENPNADTAAGNRTNPLLGKNREGRGEVLRDTWVEAIQRARAPFQPDNGVPDSSVADAEQQSRVDIYARRGPSSRRNSMRVSEV